MQQNFFVVWHSRYECGTPCLSGAHISSRIVHNTNNSTHTAAFHNDKKMDIALTSLYAMIPTILFHVLVTPMTIFLAIRMGFLQTTTATATTAAADTATASTTTAATATTTAATATTTAATATTTATVVDSEEDAELNRRLLAIGIAPPAFADDEIARPIPFEFDPANTGLISNRYHQQRESTTTTTTTTTARSSSMTRASPRQSSWAVRRHCQQQSSPCSKEEEAFLDLPNGVVRLVVYTKACEFAVLDVSNPTSGKHDLCWWLRNLRDFDSENYNMTCTFTLRGAKEPSMESDDLGYIFFAALSACHRSDTMPKKDYLFLVTIASHLRAKKFTDGGMCYDYCLEELRSKYGMERADVFRWSKAQEIHAAAQ